MHLLTKEFIDNKVKIEKSLLDFSGEHKLFAGALRFELKLTSVSGGKRSVCS